MTDVERLSGMTQSEEVTADVVSEADLPVDASLADVPGLSDREVDTLPAFRKGNTGFTRMRRSMDPDDRAFLDSVNDMVAEVIQFEFADAFRLMNAIYNVVREPKVDEHNQPLTDAYGQPVWDTDDNGDWIEDWDRLTSRQRESFLFEITTRLFRWEQDSVTLWSEAMMMKAQWEERFSAAYITPGNSQVEGKTIEARTSFAKRSVSEDRYRAILHSTISRRADAVVRSMTLIGQRLKDTHPQ